MNRIISQGIDPKRQKPEQFEASLNNLIQKISLNKSRLSQGNTGNSTGITPPPAQTGNSITLSN